MYTHFCAVLEYTWSIVEHILYYYIYYYFMYILQAIFAEIYLHMKVSIGSHLHMHIPMSKVWFMTFMSNQEWMNTCLHSWTNLLLIILSYWKACCDTAQPYDKLTDNGLKVDEAVKRVDISNYGLHKVALQRTYGKEDEGKGFVFKHHVHKSSPPSSRSFSIKVYVIRGAGWERAVH